MAIQSISNECMRTEEADERHSNKKETSKNTNKRAKCPRSKPIMKQKILISFIALTLFVGFIIQAPDLGDAKKIKIKLKDLKKLKKYAYLLAGQRKKFYAIPFPFPLPVFVKRQHIYTQIPVIHRQVPMPQPYGSPSMSADSYESMTSSYSTPEPKYPSPSDYYSASSYLPSKSSQSSHSSQNRQPSSYLSSSLSSSLASPSTKYLAQIMSLALNQAYGGAGGHGGGNGGGGSTSSSGLGITTGREVIGKLLSGQAKVLSPASLISTLKSPSVSANGQASSSGDAGPDGYDNEHKTSSSSSSSSSATGANGSSSSGANNDAGSSGGGSSGSKPSSASGDSGETKPSASEMYRSRVRQSARHRPYRQQNPFAAYHQADPFRLASMMTLSPYAHPLAATIPLMSRLPSFQLPLATLPNLPSLSAAQQMGVGGLAADYLAAMGESQQTHQLLDQQALDGGSREPQEAAASSQQDYELAPSAAHLRHLPINGRQYLLAMQRLHRQQQEQQQGHQEELRLLALAREREALRLAESRAILVRAHQLGIPVNNHE